jgi:hypothetical protein
MNLNFKQKRSLKRPGGGLSFFMTTATNTYSQLADKPGTLLSGIINNGIEHVLDETPFEGLTSSIQKPITMAGQGLDKLSAYTTKQMKAGIKAEYGELFEDAEAVAALLGLHKNKDKRAALNRVSTRAANHFGVDPDMTLRASSLVGNVAENQHLWAGDIEIDHEKVWKGFSELVDPTNKQNPLFEGGMHSYPATGNTLVGDGRSAYDSAPGSRSIYDQRALYNPRSAAPKTYDYSSLHKKKVDAQKVTHKRGTKRKSTQKQTTSKKQKQTGISLKGGGVGAFNS